MTLLYAIDPGNAAAKDRVCYVARFDARELLDVKALTWRDIQAWALEPADRRTVAVEKPQQDGRSRAVPPKVLIDLAWNGALVAAALRPSELVTYTPTEWKGSVSKPVHHLRIWAELSEFERKAFPADTEERIRKGAEATARNAGKLTAYAFEAHNLLDAAGLGLFHLGRLGRGGASVKRAGRAKRVTFSDIAREYRKAGGT
jgi:hypothetical protein